MQALTTRVIRSATYRPAKATRRKAPHIPGAPQKWFHVCSVADMTRNGHPIGEDELSAYVADFYAGPEAGPIYLGHQDAERGPGEPEAPAAGWVLAMELRPNGQLWALYELKPEVYAEVKSGGYRYNSICGRFDRDKAGTVSAEFWSIAITNSPAVVGLTPMAASRRNGKEAATMAADKSMKEALQAALKDLPDDATAEVAKRFIAARLDALAALHGEMETEPAEEEVEASETVAASDAAPPADAEEEPVALMEMEGEEGGAMADSALAMVAEQAGVDMAAVIAAIQEDPAAFAALVSGGAGGDGGEAEQEAFAASSRVKALTKQLSDKSGEVQTLSKRLAKLEADGREREVDQAIQAGLFAGDRERLVTLAREAPAVWAKWLADAKASPEVPSSEPVYQPPKTTEGRGDMAALSRNPLTERLLERAIPNPEKRAAFLKANRKEIDRA